jgi:hypothetical protein
MKLVKSLTILSLIVLCVACSHKEEINWKIAENPIITDWAKDVDPLKPWAQYPRPDMVRPEWMNLNGMWNYAITPKGKKPDRWDGSILVPYPPESALSGIRRKVTEKENLWYKRTFNIPDGWEKKHILLNFEACDWETTIWVDGKEAGTHKGGYDPFSFDITALIGKSKLHELLVCVWDPTDKGTQPRGKQVSSPGSIWYTSTTGIWQTVWLEPVEESYISSFRTVTNADNGTVTIKTDVKNAIGGTLSIKIKKDGRTVAKATGLVDEAIALQIKNPLLWTPDKPVLYDISIELIFKNKTTDKVKSYTGIRKISLGKTSDGFTRMLLNNEFVYQNGPLDQGFWPDGIYTPPTENAMVYDLRMTKKMGFNMLRKHVKVENRLFYYWCDKLGILVWQDMPSGDKYISGNMPDITRSKESSDEYEIELKRMIDTKYNHPSIIMWVPFNEGWGQFDTERITKLIAAYDKTRLVNSSSGWTDRGTGNISDIHHYPEPAVQAAEDKRAIVLGEFGGLGLPLQGHTWEQKNWGYRNMSDTLQLLSRYETYYDMVQKYVKENGLSATIYTQTTDVETETNGLMTYDRKINKMGAQNVFKANMNIIPPSLSSPLRDFINEYTVELKNNRLSGKIFYTTDGSEPTIKSLQYNSPFKVSATTTIKAFTKWDDAESRTISYTLQKKEPVAAIVAEKVRPGLRASVYSGDFSTLPSFSVLKPAMIKYVPDVSHSVAGKDSLFAVVYEGYVQIPADGVYGFYISSDDGSKMIIDSSEPVINDGIHGMKEEGRNYPLAQGYHKLRIEYFQRFGGLGLEFLVEAPGMQKAEVPAGWLFN